MKQSVHYNELVERRFFYTGITLQDTDMWHNAMKKSVNYNEMIERWFPCTGITLQDTKYLTQCDEIDS